MTNLESPPPSPAHLPPEKPPESENSEPIINEAVCASSSSDHRPDDRHSRIMENFKDIIFKFATSSSPTKSLSPTQRSVIEKYLDEAFPSFRTPVHPPYSAMIESAINELGEEGGSSEESISQFIRKKYLDLPWAHDAFLKHHLENLCENGSIIKTYNGFYMFQKVVNNQDSSSAHDPSASVDAYSTLSLSPPDCSCNPNSSSDNSSSPRTKRKRQMYTMRSKKHKRINRGKAKCTSSARVANWRHRRPLKQYVSEDETEASDELLMLGLTNEETEDDNESEEECSEGAESIEEVSGKRQRIMKQVQRQKTGSVIEIQMNNHEVMVDEGQREEQTRGAKGRKVHLRPRYTPGRRTRTCKKILSLAKTQPKMEEIETDIQYSEKAEVSKEKYRIDKELADAVKGHNQVQGNTHETLESSRVENICVMSNSVKSELVEEVKELNPCNFFMEVVPEKDDGVKECGKQKLHDNLEGIEEHNAVLDQEHIIGRKRRGWPLKKSIKHRKVEVNPKQAPGRSRGRPQKKDLSVEKAQLKEQQIQDSILGDITEVPVQKCDTSKELIEVAEEHSQSQGNLCETLERSSCWEIKMAKEIEKSKEEKKIREQFNLGMEGVPENDEATKGCDGQKELKKFIGSEEETQFKEPKWGLKQNQSNQQKGRGKLLSRCTKSRDVYKKYSQVPGRGRVRPCEKDILVERAETKGEQAETNDTHQLKLKENTEVHKENCAINKGSTKEVEIFYEIERNMYGTLEWTPEDKTNFVKEVRNSGLDAEENIEIKMDFWNMEGQQQDGGIKEFEPENAFNDEKNQSSKEMTEMNLEENQQKRQETEKQNQQSEEGLKDCCILEGEEQQGCGDAFNEEQDHSSKEKSETPVEKNQPRREENAEQNQQIEEGSQDCCMTESEQQQDCNVVGLDMQKEAGNSFNEEENQCSEEKNEMTFEENQPKRSENEEHNQQQEDGLKSDTEDETEVSEMFGHDTQIQANIQSKGQNESIKKAIVFPDQSSDSVPQRCKIILNSSMEELNQMVRESKLLETEVVEQKPESSSAGNAQLKSVEGSSEPKNLLQQQVGEEKLVDGQLCTRPQKSKNLCCIL